jgi:hypothetical protein
MHPGDIGNEKPPRLPPAALFFRKSAVPLARARRSVRSLASRCAGDTARSDPCKRANCGRGASAVASRVADKATNQRTGKRPLCLGLAFTAGENSGDCKDGADLDKTHFDTPLGIIGPTPSKAIGGKAK